MEKLACGIYEYITHLKFVKISLILTSLINKKFFEAPNSQGFKSYSSSYSIAKTYKRVKQLEEFANMHFYIYKIYIFITATFIKYIIVKILLLFINYIQQNKEHKTLSSKEY